MSIITKSQLESGVNGQSISGVVLLKDYCKKLTKGGKDYIEGTLQSGAIMSFKVWSGTRAISKMLSANYSGLPCMISGEFSEYQGVVSMTINDIDSVAGFSQEQFLEERYNTNGYLTNLKNTLTSCVSEAGMSLLNKILFDDEDLVHKFSVEFAASNHHDNCKSGLLVHTYKVVMLVNWIVSVYPTVLIEETDSGLVSSQNRKDLLFIGALLHDIGKVQEMNWGIYQPNSAVTHRVLGLDLLYKYKDLIIGTYNEKWFRDLQSIIVEHHGDYGDQCRTIVSYIISKADLLDSQMTGLEQNMKQASQNSVGYVVWQDKLPLTI